MGTVISAVGPHEWNVLFDYNGKIKKVTSKSFTVVSSLTGIPLHVSDLQVSKNSSIAYVHEAK